MSFDMEALPRIACFHGGGTTAAIYQLQCEPLMEQFRSTFEFVFFDAPFYRDAGPGVLPFFEPKAWGPYRMWFSKNAKGEERDDGRSQDGKSEGGIERILRLLDEAPPGGEWVACMGFSQGTRIVAGLLLDQQRRKMLKLPKAEGNIDFKFGILCMGSQPPMVSDTAHMADDDNVIKIPTLHLHGLKDAMYEHGKAQLKTYFDPKTVSVLDIDYHHAMPWIKADLIKLSDGIRKIYKENVKEDDW